MAKNDHKLELSWYNKSKSLYYDLDKKEYLWVDKKDPRVSEPRILLEKTSNGDKNSENLLIKGDNLLALKALLPDYAGEVKLIYIDPPFNTGTAFEFYDDGLEHSIWLTMMRDRLELLKKLLKKEGAIFVHISDIEEGYLRVLLDEVFGRYNFINKITVKTKAPSGFKTVNLGVFETSEYILAYAKNKPDWVYIPQYVECPYDLNYNKIIHNKEANYSEWKVSSVSDEIAKILGYSTVREAKKALGKYGFLERMAEYAVKNAESIFRFTEIDDKGAGAETVRVKQESLNDNKVHLVKRENYDNRYIFKGKEISFYTKKLRKIDGKMLPSIPLTNLWTDIPWESIASEGNVRLKRGKKPERLIKRIIEMSTNKGDLVLDSFAGSGTTGAVAHKMGRGWVMVEFGEQANTHIIPRMKRVISGEDQNGISKAVGWKGGGGFKYFELGDSLFVADDDLRLTVLNPKVYNGALIRAVLKVEGFKLLNPDNALHGISGRTIAHVTEQYLNQDYVNAILREVGDAADYLIVYAKTISSKIKLPENVEIRKIPDVLLKKFKV